MIAADDVRDAALDGELEKFVIVRITAGVDCHFNLDPFRFSDQNSEKSLRFILGNVLEELRSDKDVVQFDQDRVAQKDFTNLLGAVEGTPGNEVSISNALTSTLVSKTKRKLRFSQEGFQHFGRDATSLGFLAYLAHDLLQRRGIRRGQVF